MSEAPCKLWTGSIDRYGYGRHPGGKIVHREAWIAVHGPPPPDKPLILHTCDNPPCWEITHLWAGSHADNMADMAAKGRAFHQKKDACKRGHEFTSENTRVDKRGWRWCRACSRINSAKYKAARRRR